MWHRPDCGPDFWWLFCDIKVQFLQFLPPCHPCSRQGTGYGGEEGRFRFRKVPWANSLLLTAWLWEGLFPLGLSFHALMIKFFPGCCCLFYCCFKLSTWYSLQLSRLRNCLDQTALWARLLATVLIVHRRRRVQPTVGGTIPRLVSLNCLRKLAEYKLAWEPMTSIVYGSCSASLAVYWIPWLEVLLCEIADRLALNFCLRFLPCLPINEDLQPGIVSLINSLFPIIAFGQRFFFFYRDNRLNESRTGFYSTDLIDRLWRPSSQKELIFLEHSEHAVLWRKWSPIILLSCPKVSLF